MSLDLHSELIGINENLIRADYYYITKDQVMSLASLMSMGLSDNSREMRVAVLRLLAGDAMKYFEGEAFEINSTKNIIGGIASFLIDQLLEPQSKPWRLSVYGRELLAACEDEIKEQTQI